MIAATSAVIVIGIVIVGSSSAHAQNAEAEAMFNEGNKLLAEGKLAQACDSFEASNRIEPRAGTLIRLGECREKNHQVASAWSAYKDAITRVRDPLKRDIATARATELEAKLSYLTISVPDESRVDGLAITRNAKPLDPMLWNRALPVDGGSYTIGGHAPGHAEWETTVTVPDESGKVTVDVPKFKELSKLVERAVTKTAKLNSEVDEDEDTARPTALFTIKRKIAVGAAGAGVLGVAAGIVLAVQAKGKQADAHALCPDPQTPCADADRANALIESSRSRTLSANIAFGTAAAAAIGAGVLWFIGAPESTTRHVAVVPVVAPGETGVVVVGRL